MTGLEYKNNLSCKRHGADLNLEDVTDAYEDGIAEGYRRCKADMMKEAVEGRIGKVAFHNAVYVQEPKWTNFLDGFKDGDKVRIIIVKEDEK